MEFTETEKALTNAELNDFEEYVGLQLPEQYRNHLLTYNGGRCEPNVFDVSKNGKPNQSCIDWFLAIYDGEADNLKDYVDDVKIKVKRMPQHILPIAHDPGGNLICISCGDKDNGAIYFWDHENEVDYSIAQDDDYSNLYLIARSLHEFFDSLK